MEVEVILSPAESGLYDFTEKTAVVIDVFRFATTILVALEAGVEAFFPVREVEEALQMKKAEPGLLLGGERGALMISGFDFGNSPLEHMEQHYSGGRLVCTTTNGTQALHGAQGAAEVLVASLRNAQATARYLKAAGRDVLFFPAGLKGKFSLEDVWCAGLITTYLPRAVLGDGARTARALHSGVDRIMLRDTAHGRILRGLGLSADLDFCLQADCSSNAVLWDPKSGWGALAR